MALAVLATFAEALSAVRVLLRARHPLLLVRRTARRCARRRRRRRAAVEPLGRLRRAVPRRRQLPARLSADLAHVAAAACRCSSSSSPSGTPARRGGRLPARAPARPRAPWRPASPASATRSRGRCSPHSASTTTSRARPGCRGCCGRSRGCCERPGAARLCVLGLVERGPGARGVGRPRPDDGASGARPACCSRSARRPRRAVLVPGPRPGAGGRASARSERRPVAADARARPSRFSGRARTCARARTGRCIRGRSWIWPCRGSSRDAALSPADARASCSRGASRCCRASTSAS